MGRKRALGLIEDHQVLATGIDKGLSQADKGRSQATQDHLNPILGAPPPSPQNSPGGLIFNIFILYPISKLGSPKLVTFPNFSLHIDGVL